MRKIITAMLIILCLAAFILIAERIINKDAIDNTSLWPDIEPYYTDFLRVSELHQIYYELSGNKDGQPVFFLHGGPGGRSMPYMRRFCNHQKFLIVLHDQRGCGKSKPYGELKENTTQNLVKDIEQLRKHLKLGKIILFGGSWGSTLALAYAESYPENIMGLILRGVFTATKAEIDHYYHQGLKKFFPEVHDKLRYSLPDPEKQPLPDYLYELIKSGNNPEKKKYSNAWAEYEIKTMGLHIKDDMVKNIMKGRNFYAFGLLENYYMSQGCFLQEGQLLKNAERIKSIPTIIINGRYDVICPPITAYRLYQKLQKSKLIIVEEAGHWMGEKPIEKALLKAMRIFE